MKVSCTTHLMLELQVVPGLTICAGQDIGIEHCYLEKVH